MRWRELGDGRVRARTSRRVRVEANHLVVAAGYEAAELLRLRRGRLRTTYALVTEPTPGTGPRALLWETARPYVYARPARDGRWLAGGFDSRCARTGRTERRLRRRSRRVLHTLREWLGSSELEIGTA